MSNLHFFKSMVCVGAVMLYAAASHAVVVFQDDFNDGSIGAAWTRSGSATTESGGSLNLAVNADGAQSTTIRTGLSGDFNFFDQPLLFSLDISGYSTGTGGNYFIFALSSTGTNVGLTGDPDLFAVRINIDSNVVEVGAKENGGGTSVFATANRLANQNVGSVVTGFSLLLDATTFSLTVHKASSPDTVLNGNHGLSLANWGDAGSSSLQMQYYRATAGTAGSFGVDGIMVEAIPEPGTVGMLLMGAVGAACLVLARKRRGGLSPLS